MKTAYIAFLGIACIVTAAIAGCTGPGGESANLPEKTPVGTPIPAGNLVVTQDEDGALVSVDQGCTITLTLPENPTTGYQWNLTLSEGLAVNDDTYEPADSTGTMAGSGGTRVWEIKAVLPGRQEIGAVYIRPWEPVIGNETAFAMAVDVTAA